VLTRRELEALVSSLREDALISEVIPGIQNADGLASALLVPE
jgi:hypothetical protein